MKEYVIKHIDCYVLEEVDGITRVKQIEQASTFPSIENANKFCINDLHNYGIKREHIQLIEVERVTITRTLLYKDKQWQYSNHQYQDRFDAMMGNPLGQLDSLIGGLK